MFVMRLYLQANWHREILVNVSYLYRNIVFACVHLCLPVSLSHLHANIRNVWHCQLILHCFYCFPNQAGHFQHLPFTPFMRVAFPNAQALLTIHGFWHTLFQHRQSSTISFYIIVYNFSKSNHCTWLNFSSDFTQLNDASNRYCFDNNAWILAFCSK